MAEISRITGEEGTDVCRVTGFDLGGREIHMAEIKQRYIPNIIDAARKCDYIDRVVLFGSSLEERCLAVITF